MSHPARMVVSSILGNVRYSFSADFELRHQELVWRGVVVLVNVAQKSVLKFFAFIIQVSVV